eukprot:GHRQ01027880.1.p1 GENE.GHRQ01027880.1~~GHRQ01027880.1.p1  ORF type:complete len:320 (+),score=26.48 GHRQ01027880.1:99-1058(+)
MSSRLSPGTCQVLVQLALRVPLIPTATCNPWSGALVLTCDMHTFLSPCLWCCRAGGTSWVVFEDRCPHRLAPLSEGRLEPATGHLMCSYHGAPPLQPVCCSCAQTAWVLEHHNEAILRHKLHSPHKHGKVPAEHTKMWMRQADMCSLQLHAAQPTINAVVLLPAAFASKLLHMFMTLQAGSLTPRASARPFPRLGSQQRTQRRAAASAPAPSHTPARCGGSNSRHLVRQQHSAVCSDRLLSSGLLCCVIQQTADAAAVPETRSPCCRRKTLHSSHAYRAVCCTFAGMADGCWAFPAGPNSASIPPCAGHSRKSQSRPCH